MMCNDIVGWCNVLRSYTTGYERSTVQRTIIIIKIIIVPPIGLMSSPFSTSGLDKVGGGRGPPDDRV